MVLGDSCIIVIHWDVNKIDVLSSEDKEFDSYPDYVDSNPNSNGKGIIRDLHGTINQDTTLLLVSDPFSDFLSKNENNALSLVNELVNIKSHKEYVVLVDKWRHEGMHNDDSSLVVITYDEQSKFILENVDNLEELIKLETASENSEKALSAEQTLKGVTEENAVNNEVVNPTAAEDFTNNEQDISEDNKEDDSEQSELDGNQEGSMEQDILPTKSNNFDLQFLKDKPEDVVEQFLCSQKARSLSELFEWLIRWRQQVKTTLMKYNEFILSIDSKKDYDTDSST
jgi:hypothetical protein